MIQIFENNELTIVSTNSIFESKDRFSELITSTSIFFFFFFNNVFNKNLDIFPKLHNNRNGNIKDIMENEYNVNIYEYTNNSTELLRDKHFSSKHEFEKFLNTAQSRVCLIIGQRVARSIIGTSNVHYGNSATLNLSNQMCDFFIIPSTITENRQTKTHELNQWFSQFESFLNQIGVNFADYDTCEEE